MYQETAPTPATRPSGYLLMKRSTRLLGIGQLAQVERRPEVGRLALQHRHLRHHRDVGGRLAGLRRLLQLDEPCLAGRLRHGFDGDAGRLGEFGEDVLVEAIFEIAAIDADLERLVLRPQHVRHRQHRRARQDLPSEPPGGSLCPSDVTSFARSSTSAVNLHPAISIPAAAARFGLTPCARRSMGCRPSDSGSRTASGRPPARCSSWHHIAARPPPHRRR